ncbi:substrate-binding periplasmic protein [Streptomyces bullii]|uniref:Substrate-binding periplasmic protein n=1 Tax=Streptomyces bullii TaxID=349910 RepID=A0ABW0UJB6_9ACTN
MATPTAAPVRSPVPPASAIRLSRRPVSLQVTMPEIAGRRAKVRLTVLNMADAVDRWCTRNCPSRSAVRVGISNCPPARSTKPRRTAYIASLMVTASRISRSPTVIVAAVTILAVASLSGCSGGSSPAAVSADCKPKHRFKTLKKGTLTVVSFDFPPFSKIQGNNLTGIDGEIVQATAKMECLTLSVQPAGAAAVIPTAQAGRAALAAGDWYRTAERAKVVDLSDPLYLDEMALVSEQGVNSIPDLKSKGLTVGTTEGFPWVSDLKDHLGGKLKTYASPVNRYQDLAGASTCVSTATARPCTRPRAGS